MEKLSAEDKRIKEAEAAQSVKLQTLKSARIIRAATNQTWNLANKAPMYTRKTIGKAKTTAKGNKVVRTKRLINGHAYKIAASGAAAYATAVMKREGESFRVPVNNESKRCPWQVSITKGAIAVLEGFLCAYTQEATRHAVSIKTGLGTHQRLNGKLMKLGYELADANVFGSATPCARNLIVCKPPKKASGKEKGKKTEEEDFAPPEAE